MSPEYKAALDKVTAVSAKFREVTAKYRAREIGDAEFLAAKAEMTAADAEFDRACEAEEKRDDLHSDVEPS